MSYNSDTDMNEKTDTRKNKNTTGSCSKTVKLNEYVADNNSNVELMTNLMTHLTNMQNKNMESLAGIIGNKLGEFALQLNNNNQQTETTTGESSKAIAVERNISDPVSSVITQNSRSMFSDEDHDGIVPNPEIMQKRIEEITGENRGEGEESSDSGSEKDETEEGTGLLKQLVEELNKTEDVAPDLQPDLAVIVNTTWQLPTTSKDTVKEKQQKYLRPKNCKDLVIKSCNPEFWNNKLQSYQRQKDLSLQRIQNNVLRGNIAIAQVTDELVKMNQSKTVRKHVPNLSLLIRTCTDAMTLLGEANQEGDKVRMSCLGMDKEFPGISKNITLPSEFLYGEEVTKKIADIKVNSKIISATPDNRHHPYKPKYAYSHQSGSKNEQRFPKNPGNHYGGHSNNNNKSHYHNRPRYPNHKGQKKQPKY